MSPAAPARDAAALAEVAHAFGAEVAWIHTSDLLGLVCTLETFAAATVGHR